MPNDDIQRGLNYPLVILVTILFTAFLLSVITSVDRPFDKLYSFINTLSAKDGILAFFTPLISLVLSSAFAKNLKEMLVFWKLQDILPGHRAFSRIIHDIEPNVLELDLLTNMLKDGIIKKDDLPVDPAEQNAVWYKIYLVLKREEDKDIISKSKNYIRLRDSATVGFMFFFFGTIGLVLTHTSVKWIPVYSVVCLILYVLLARGARNMAINLVHAVLYKYAAGSK
jgi:hypothetical protein